MSLESSLRNRIVALENDQTLFLLDKERGLGLYWTEVKITLDQASSQKEYNRLLDFENRDLQMRELKHSCYALFQQVVSANPDLLNNSYYQNPEKALISFLEDMRDELECELPESLIEVDPHEKEILEDVQKDFLKYGGGSYFVKKIVGFVD